MTADCTAESPESIQLKIEETRERFRSEYVQESSSDKYEASDLERLWRDDVLVDSYLEWGHHDVAEALKMIAESFQWRKELCVNDINESSVSKHLMETGMHYLHGYDKEGNKLFWFRVKLLAKQDKLQEKRKYVAFWLESFIRREPGALLTVVFDMTDSGLSNVDMDFVKYIINCFQVYYPRLLYKIFVYEVPWIMNAAWKIIKSWLDPEAIDKLKFVSKTDILTYIDPEHLPFHMGGTDSFAYSYPPLPGDFFQSPISKPSQDEEMETKEKQNSEPALRPRKVCFADEGDTDAASRGRYPHRPTTTFKGSLLHVSPAEALSFGQKETERRCLIILNNVTKNSVAYKVRTTAPEKYRVKTSSGSCAAGTSVEITVSLHGGSQSLPQDRFLVMAAEMEPVVTQDLTQFWKDTPKAKVMEHRLKCHVLQGLKPTLSQPTNITNGHQDTHTTLLRLLSSSGRLEQKLDRCLWIQKVLIVLVTALGCSTLYMLYGGNG